MSEPGALSTAGGVVGGGRHPVADLLVRAWGGPRPDLDGRWARVHPWREGVYAVVAVTGRAMISAPRHVTDADLGAWGVDGFGGAHDPRVMTRLAGERGWVDVLDAVLLAEGTGSTTQHGLVPRPDLRDHPRVRHALPIRGDVQVFGLVGDDESVLTLATGIGGLPELSFQVAPSRRGTGLGTRWHWPPAVWCRRAPRWPPACHRPTCRVCARCCGPASTRSARCRSTARRPEPPGQPAEIVSSTDDVTASAPWSVMCETVTVMNPLGPLTTIERPLTLLGPLVRS